MRMRYDVIIIGGGPSGLMAANQFEKANINYLLLEKNDTYGKKLLLTGGKRCNVTNHLSVRDFIDNLTFPHKKFLYPCLKLFGPTEIRAFFEDMGLKLVLEDDFKYFPITGKSSSVLDVLTRKLKKNHLRFNQSVKKIEKLNGVFKVFSKNNEYQALSVIVATGSNSFPSTGSSGDGLKFASDLNIDFHEFTPAETYVYSSQVVEELKGLQGVSIRACHVRMKQMKKAYEGDLLFTHIGLSGPAIMHLSEFIYDDIKTNNFSVIEFGFVGQTSQELYQILMENKDKTLAKVLKKYANNRVVNILLERLKISSMRIMEIKKKDLMHVCEVFTRFQVKIDKVEDKEKAYVNRGGIDLKALDPKSMESKQIAGLYFIGETTDLHGPIGGYNLTIALSTAYTSALDLIGKL